MTSFSHSEFSHSELFGCEKKNCLYSWSFRRVSKILHAFFFFQCSQFYYHIFLTETETLLIICTSTYNISLYISVLVTWENAVRNSFKPLNSVGLYHFHSFFLWLYIHSLTLSALSPSCLLHFLFGSIYCAISELDSQLAYKIHFTFNLSKLKRLMCQLSLLFWLILTLLFNEAMQINRPLALAFLTCDMLFLMVCW